MFRFLRFFALLPVLLITSNVMAAGYVCEELIEYTECESGYFLNATGAGNDCVTCDSVPNVNLLASVDIDNGVRQQACTGYYTGGTGGSDVGTYSCTGCSASEYQCVCDPGYVVSGDGESCTCVAETGFTCSERYTSCKPGYYLTYNGVYDATPKAGNKCTKCEAGYACAGDLADRGKCIHTTYSDAGATVCSDCPAKPSFDDESWIAELFQTDWYPRNADGVPDESYDVEVVMIADGDDTVTPHAGIEMCNMHYRYETAAGLLLVDNVQYNLETGRYDSLANIQVPYYARLNPGFIVKDPYCLGTGSNNWRYYFKYAQVCPAGSYCTGRKMSDFPMCPDDLETELVQTFGADGCASGYNSEPGASSVEQCLIACPGGTYLAAANDATCSDVGVGYYAVPQDVPQGQAGIRVQCPDGETTIGFGAGADEAGDCGVIMHVGDASLYLRSDKKTTPSLNVLRGGKRYYANMSVTEESLSYGSSRKFRSEANDIEYWIHDDSSVMGEMYACKEAGATWQNGECVCTIGTINSVDLLPAVWNGKQCSCVQGNYYRTDENGIVCEVGGTNPS